MWGGLCHPLSFKVNYGNFFIENAPTFQVQMPSSCFNKNFLDNFRACDHHWRYEKLLFLLASSNMYQRVLFSKLHPDFQLCGQFFHGKGKKNHCKKPYLFSIKDSNNTVIGSKLSCQILYLVLAIQPVLGTGIARNCDWHDYLLSKYCWTSGHCRCHGFILLKCLQCTMTYFSICIIN